MKIRSFPIPVHICLLSLALWREGFAQSTAFTYQGRLTTNGAPYSGPAEFQFTLWDSATNGTAVATNDPSSIFATVNDGLFTVALEFGMTPFNGDARFLQIDVRTVIGPFSTLTPRQPVTSTPYAVRALSLATNGLATGTYGNAVAFDNSGNSFVGSFTGTLTGAASGDGAGLTNVNAGALGGLMPTDFWKTSGNAGADPTNGAFLGTTDLQPLELRVNDSRALRLEPGTNIYSIIGAPNVIGGAPNNFADGGVVGATIAGGGALNMTGFLPIPSPNHVSAIFGAIGGGRLNSVGADHSTIAGGLTNTILPYAYDSAIGGGYANLIGSGSTGAVIGGGHNNSANGVGATVSGGYFNNAAATYATVGGGGGNTASGQSATVGGGYGNTASGQSATVGGGNGNIADYLYATVSGGSGNAASGSYATVPGGSANAASGGYSFAAGDQAQALHLGSFVWADASGASFASTAANQFSVRAGGGVRLAADVEIGTSAGDYRRLEMGGGNSSGFLYGSYPHWGDGLHLGYNYYADSSGGNHIINSGGGTSRITVGYGSIVLATGSAGVQPNFQNLVVDTTTVTVNGTFNNNSDRNAKEDFAPVDPSHILDKVTQLPVSKWRYKTDPATRHLGPMAQDFYSSFQIGTDDRHIAPIDEGGVALAAIQGLNQKLDSENAALRQELKRQDAENGELKKEVNSLKQLVNQLNQRLEGATN